MPVESSEAFFSPATLLWLVASLTAAAILFGSINRRRSQLTDTLRGYVDRNQEGRRATRLEEGPSGDESSED